MHRELGFLQHTNDPTVLIYWSSEHQYKYHLKKWGYAKNVPKAVKEEACKALGKRSRDATSTSVVEYKGEVIDKTKLRRHMIALARQHNALRLSNNVYATEDCEQLLYR
jgi:hypothetical protein